MIKIKEIAKLANVAPSTVSKALNNRMDISEATRQDIIRIAKQHAYYPLKSTGIQKTKAKENIGIIFSREENPLSTNPFYSCILESIESELNINNYNLVLTTVGNNSRFLLPKMVHENNVDGIILMGAFCPRLFEGLRKVKIPIVFIDPQNPNVNYSKIIIDNEQGAYLAASYLVQAGHRRIAFISGDLSRNSFKQRYDGYIKALRQNKIKIDEKMIRCGGLEDGYSLAKKLLQAERISAIFVANDINAMHVYRAVFDLNLRIPQDVSIVGFDDIAMARYAIPPLTTIHVYKDVMGSFAVRILLKYIQDGMEVPVTTIVPIKLIERESVMNLNETKHVIRRVSEVHSE
jgi:LacI family transcriptional regulator